MTEDSTESSRGRRSKVARLIDEYDLDGLGDEMTRRWTAEDDRWSLRDLADHYDAYEEILDLHKEANQLEYELGRLEGDLEDVVDEIEEIESRLNHESDLEGRRKELDEEVEDLRTKIERIESQAVAEFNEHMDSVLEILEYANLERIWLERFETEVREGRR